MTEAADAGAAWVQYSMAREKATFATAALLICLIVPAWSALDFYLEPAAAPSFLVVRLIDVVVTVALWLVIARSNDIRRNRHAMTAMMIAVGLTGGWLLPHVAGHYVLYALGVSLVFWGTGVVLLIPLRFAAVAFAMILAGDASFGLLDRVSRSDFIGLYFYLVSAATISAAQLVVRRRLEHAAFRASFGLGQRNEVLATTQARLHASSAALAESLDGDAIARHVVELAVPAVATWATLVAGGPRDTRICASAHQDPARRPDLAAALAADLPSAWPASLATDAIVRADREQVLRAVGARVAQIVAARSLIVVPLVARGTRSGTLVLGWSGRVFEPNELVFAEEIARRAAQAVDNARLFKEAEDAIRLRDDFISIASHELRTPLSALALCVETQVMITPPDEPHHPVFVKLDRLVARMATLVGHLLDVSQITAGRLALDLQDMDLVTLIRELTDDQAEAAGRAGSTIELDVPPHVAGRWDRARLERAFANLLGNAIKYGRGRPIQIRVETHDGRVRVTVTDEGIGIAPADQARIFERFERAVTGKHSAGFGLGLWITRTIIEAHGGEIRCTSEPGRGSTFTVELPR